MYTHVYKYRIPFENNFAKCLHIQSGTSNLDEGWKGKNIVIFLISTDGNNVSFLIFFLCSICKGNMNKQR
jgi:hypothetical protein